MKIVRVLGLSFALVVLFSACSSNEGSSAAGCPTAANLEPIASPTTIPPGAPTPPAAVLTPVVAVAEGSAGTQILTDSGGYTLYTFKDDVPSSGVSQCGSQCPDTWTPFVEAAGFTPQTPGLPGRLGSFSAGNSRSRHLMYKGKPLYFYSGDKNPGDVKGPGHGAGWCVAVP